MYADLVPIVVDHPGGLAAAGASAPALPPAAAAASWGAHGAAVRHDTSLAVMATQNRRGHWEVGETTIHAYAVMGGVEVVVNAGTRVSGEGFGVRRTKRPRLLGG